MSKSDKIPTKPKTSEAAAPRSAEVIVFPGVDLKELAKTWQSPGRASKPR